MAERSTVDSSMRERTLLKKTLIPQAAGGTKRTNSPSGIRTGLNVLEKDTWTCRGKKKEGHGEDGTLVSLGGEGLRQVLYDLYKEATISNNSSPTTLRKEKKADRQKNLKTGNRSQR